MMRLDVTQKMKNLLQEKKMFGYKDGWVYGRLKQEFELTSDELDFLTQNLGFKYGWNSTVEEILEGQWQEESEKMQELEKAKERQLIEQTQMKMKLERAREMQSLEIIKNELANQVTHLKIKENLEQKIQVLMLEYQNIKFTNRNFTDIDRAIITLIMKMTPQEKLSLLEMLYNRSK